MIVGLTGGIGSGKSTVAKFFKELGVPVYIADLEAKKLMETNDDIRRDIISIFGADAYENNLPNRKYLAEIVFENPEKLEQLNAIIHPAVGKHFEEWYQQQKVPYVIKEVAILFENGGDKQCDLVITVTAPKEIRIERVLKRDQTTRKAIEARMQNQWSDKEKIKKSDFVIENIVIDNTHQIVEELHRMILKKSI
ncbi:dephospho-CoA kinase [Galbibacter orientalis DSM 19592]|uniref:Dephospho-CoA kinase n=1 Tax=Galbibacter orientalis DSM 19592 TaxID=926559 RepID=I3C954_9FLAO|nr:dephospho-CoA kinase [Galbibacter orientalis]EIJ40147.1 dephospho-CoA kinase [Galbibacter orientalis DSM 19592]